MHATKTSKAKGRRLARIVPDPGFLSPELPHPVHCRYGAGSVLINTEGGAVSLACWDGDMPGSPSPRSSGADALPKAGQPGGLLSAAGAALLYWMHLWMLGGASLGIPSVATLSTAPCHCPYIS